MQSNDRKRVPKMERTRHPGIYKRGGRYVVVWRHRGRQHKSFHRTMAQALEAQGQRRQVDRRAPAGRETLEQYARNWLEHYSGRTARGLAETTRHAYRRSIESYALPFFRGHRLAEVEPPDIRAFIAEMEQGGLASASVVKNLSPLKAMFATAVEDGVLRLNPTIGVRVNGRIDEGEEEPEVKAMTRRELSRLLKALPASWRLFFELLTHAGLRISEALGLEWPDVRFGERPRLHIVRQHYRGDTRRLKSHRARRELPLSRGMARSLWSARPVAGSGPMFATSNGTRFNDRNVRRVLGRAARQAGVPWVTFHTFRHTCASLLFEGGKNIRQVSDWLGHADPAFTLRTYVHLLDNGLGGADFLDSVVGNGLGNTRSENSGKRTTSAIADSALTSDILVQPQAPATAGATS